METLKTFEKLRSGPTAATASTATFGTMPRQYSARTFFHTQALGDRAVGYGCGYGSYGGYAPSQDWDSHRSEFASSELPKSTPSSPSRTAAGPLPPCPTDFPFKPEGKGYPSHQSKSTNSEFASACEQRAPSPRSLREGLRPTSSFPMVFPQPVLLPDPATPRNSGRDRSDMHPESTPILTSRLPVVRYARDARNPGFAPVCL